MVLIRFAFFGPGRRAGSIDFTHQILADYFAARYATSMLERALKSADSTGEALKRHGQDLVIRAIGTAPVISGSLFYRYFVQALGKNPKLRRFLEQIVRTSDLQEQNVNDFLQLLLRESHSAAKLQRPTGSSGLWGSMSGIFGGRT